MRKIRKPRPTPPSPARLTNITLHVSVSVSLLPIISLPHRTNPPPQPQPPPHQPLPPPSFLLLPPLFSLRFPLSVRPLEPSLVMFPFGGEGVGSSARIFPHRVFLVRENKRSDAGKESL